MHLQFLLYALSLALGTMGSPLMAEPPLSLMQRDVVDPQSAGNDTGMVIQTASEINANILRLWPADRIITSDQLPAILAAGGNETYYLRDAQAFVNPADSTLSDKAVVPRQVCSLVTQSRVTFTHAWWGPWHHVSSCLSSNQGNGGGGNSYQQTDEYSTTVGGEISLAGEWEGVLSAAFGYSVTTGKAYSYAVTCNVNFGDAGQIWGRHRRAWAAIEKVKCVVCSGNPACDSSGTRAGYINAMADNNIDTQEWGCSTKSKSHIKC